VIQEPVTRYGATLNPTALIALWRGSPRAVFFSSIAYRNCTNLAVGSIPFLRSDDKNLKNPAMFPTARPGSSGSKAARPGSNPKRKTARHTHGQPLRNIVEMFFNEQGLPDWIITDKYPVRDRRGKVVGVIGTVQTFETRCKMLAHFGAVGQAADFIREHLSESVMLAEIARHVGLSQRQLQRLFRRAFGLTIQQFIIQSRIQAATHELTHSNRAIADIALSLGFSDQSAFTNQFRRVTGMPPRKYRVCYMASLMPG
jgi:AraC-like DNA-binding protein